MQDSFNINLPALEQWFDGHLNDHKTIDIEPIKGGGSCELFSINRGERRWAMRRAPLNAVSSSAHDVLREFAIINALQDTDIAVPRVLASEKRGGGCVKCCSSLNSFMSIGPLETSGNIFSLSLSSIF